MNQIVIVKQGEPVTTSLIIAEGVKLSHKTVIQLARQYEYILGRLGTLTFEMRKSKGRPTEFAYLNEAQTSLLITFMRNTETVVEFKVALVEEFFRIRKTLMNALISQKNEEWKQLRETGKQTRREQTDVIKRFVNYAVAQGSTNAKKYYSNITKMQNESIFFLEQKFRNIRDLLSGQQLQVIASADMIVEKALEEGMIKGMHYKDIFKLAKERVEIFASVIPRTSVPAQAAIRIESRSNHTN